MATVGVKGVKHRDGKRRWCCMITWLAVSAFWLLIVLVMTC